MNLKRRQAAGMNIDFHEMQQRLQAYDRSGRWYEISNADGANNDTAEIRIWGTIGGWFGDVDAKKFAEDLDEITANKIVVSINSRGGDVWDGVAIYNALRQHHAHITTRVDSMAASIASVIAQAGDERIMVTASQMMIHKAWGLAIGNDDEMRQLADILGLQDDIIANVYASRSDKDKETFLDMMTTETWFDADGAVDAGLADVIHDPPRKEKPEDSAAASAASNRFADLLATAVAGVEQIAAETENVVTFRLENGKTPLSDAAVAALERLTVAAEKLTGHLNDDGSGPETDAADLDQEYLRMVASSLQEI